MKLAKERTCKGIDSLGLAIFSGTSSDHSSNRVVQKPGGPRGDRLTGTLRFPRRRHFHPSCDHFKNQTREDKRLIKQERPRVGTFLSTSPRPRLKTLVLYAFLFPFFLESGYKVLYFNWVKYTSTHTHISSPPSLSPRDVPKF